MLKALLVIATLISFTPHTQAQSFENCCVCIADRDDPSTVKECNRWYRKNRGCDYRNTFDLGFDEKYGTTQCKSVTVFTAFHGQSWMSETPFRVAKAAVRNLNPETLYLDGSTCLMFNNTEDVLEHATQLALEFPEIAFEIRANQNVGLVYPMLHGKELNTATSKMTVELKGGEVRHSFDECHRYRQTCGYAPERQDYGNKNDPNEQFCMWGGELTTQRCCVRDETKDIGRWSMPGQGCD